MNWNLLGGGAALLILTLAGLLIAYAIRFGKRYEMAEALLLDRLEAGPKSEARLAESLREAGLGDLARGIETILEPHIDSGRVLLTYPGDEIVGADNGPVIRLYRLAPKVTNRLGEDS
jgi:hypothetical protein